MLVEYWGFSECVSERIEESNITSLISSDVLMIYLSCQINLDPMETIYSTPEMTITPKRTLTPMTFATTEPMPSATEYQSSAIAFLTSVPMICMYIAFFLVGLAALLAFLLSYRKLRKMEQMWYDTPLPGRLTESLVDNSTNDRTIAL